MSKSLNHYVKTYQKALQEGEIQIAYERLLKYVMALRAECQRVLGSSYTFGNVFPGYMDYSYFYFYNSFLREKKLRFGVVLNHKNMQFELWLVGRNAGVQAQYWDLLKDSKWNQGRASMPRYSVLETVLVVQPDFDQPEDLSRQIAERTACASADILCHLNTLNA